MHTHTRMCVCAFQSIYTHTYTYIHTHTHTHTRACVYVCVCVLTRLSGFCFAKGFGWGLGFTKCKSGTFKPSVGNGDCPPCDGIVDRKIYFTGKPPFFSGWLVWFETLHFIAGHM